MKMVIFSGCAAGLLVAIATSAQSRPLPRHYGQPVPIVVLPPLEAKGCYFYRGNRYCGSYCYWEINGKRYCQRREREAVPQAGVWIDDGPPLREAPRDHGGHGLK